jgi:hypothetical protein
MGTALSTSVNSTVNEINQTFNQSLNETCLSTCVNIQNGNTVILDGTTVSGDIVFTQKCTANAECAMNAALNQLSTAVQTVSQDSEASPSLFPGLQINTSVNSTYNDIKNDVTQQITALCQSSSNQTQSDNLVYAKDSEVGGNIAFQQEGQSVANCIITNSLKATSNVQQKSDQTASAGGSNLSTIIMIILAIAIIGGLGIWLFRKMDNDDCKDGKDKNGKVCTPNGSESNKFSTAANTKSVLLKAASS